MSSVVSNRARGEVRASFRRVGVRTEVGSVFETGGYRLRMPRTHAPHCEAVIVNTGGGMAGGDQVRFAFEAGLGAAVTLTTTAAEKIYRADGAATRIAVMIEAAAGAAVEWLPQETILFAGAGLDRRLEGTLAEDASLLVGEMLVFGRLAMGETMGNGGLRDRWRIRRGGRLVLAEEVRLEGAVAALLDRPALGSGARATATLLLIAPDAETRLPAARDAIASQDVVAGASAWNGMLVIRALSPSPELLRGAIVALLTVLRGRPLPRTWL